MKKGHSFLLLLLLVLVLVGVGCGSASAPEPERPVETVHGLILEVRGKSLLALESVTIGDETGRRWTFQARGRRFAAFTPSHLREHMLAGLSVGVVFHREDGILVLDDIAD